MKHAADYKLNHFVIFLYKGHHKCKAYIATQEPLPHTRNDFWRMVWEQKCTTIVMLADEDEEVIYSIANSNSNL